MKKPVKASATVRVEAAKARKAARLAKARRAGRTAMASRTAQSTLAAAIGAGILLQGGPASPPSVEMVVRTVAIAGPADVVDEPESSADESASGEAGGTGTGDTDSEATSGETVSDDSGESDTGAGGTGSDASGSDDGQAAPDGSDETTTTPSAEPEPTTEPASPPEPEVVPAPDPEPSPQPATPAMPATTAGPTAATPPSGASTTSATPTSTVVAASGAAARPAGDRTAATPTGRATHSATQNLFTRIALALAGLAPHDAHVPGGPATPTSALLIAQWAFFRRGENPLFNQSPVTSPTQSAQTATGEITGDLNASDPDRDRLTYTLTTGPRNGEVVLHDDGTYTYIPNAATAQTGGTDTFTITVRDNNPAAPGLGGFTALARHVLARSHPALAQRLFGAHAVAVTVDVIRHRHHRSADPGRRHRGDTGPGHRGRPGDPPGHRRERGTADLHRHDAPGLRARDDPSRRELRLRPQRGGAGLRAHAPGRRRHLHGAGVLGGPVELRGPRRPRRSAHRAGAAHRGPGQRAAGRDGGGRGR